MTKIKSYDQRCYDLAEYFLAYAPDVRRKQREELATVIQSAVEDYIRDFERASAEEKVAEEEAAEEKFNNGQFGAGA